MATVTQRVNRRARGMGVIVTPRSGWGISKATELKIYQKRRLTRHHKLLPTRPVDTIWQHITVTRDTGQTRVSFAHDMQTLHRIGMERFGSGVSYNYGVDMQTGQVGLGQSLDAKGTHTLNDKGIPNYSHDQNAVSLAISFIGMPGQKPSERAKLSVARLIASMMIEGVCTPNPDYNPHSMVAAKDCPTDPVREVMPEIYRNAKAIASLSRKR